MDIEKIKAFFFEAMHHGWANNQAQFVTKEYDGWKEKTWVFTSPNFPNFQLVDQYRTFSNSSTSEGRKSISFNGVPVWYMVYGGWYPKGAIRLLKSALMTAYSQNVFAGGRGVSLPPPVIGGFGYLNDWEGDFSKFHGHESIINTVRGDEIVDNGEHHYFGGIV